MIKKVDNFWWEHSLTHHRLSVLELLLSQLKTKKSNAKTLLYIKVPIKTQASQVPQSMYSSHEFILNEMTMNKTIELKI